MTAAVLLAAQAEGAHDVRGDGPLGLALVAAAALLLAAGLRPAPRVAWAASALVALAGWTTLSTAWGGVSSEAVADLDRLLLAAAALLVGSLLGSDGRRARAVVTGVALAVTILAVEVIGRARCSIRPTAAGSTGASSSAPSGTRMRRAASSHLRFRCSCGSCRPPRARCAPPPPRALSFCSRPSS